MVWSPRNYICVGICCKPCNPESAEERCVGTCSGRNRHVKRREGRGGGREGGGAEQALLFCQDHRICELRKHFPFLFTPFFEDFSAAQPFCCNRSTTSLFIIFFPSRTLDYFSFFLSLWIYMWLAKTSQQPISQTTWLKVTPHRNSFVNMLCAM